MNLFTVELKNSRNCLQRKIAIIKKFIYEKQKNEKYLFSDQDERCYHKNSEFFQKFCIW